MIINTNNKGTNLKIALICRLDAAAAPGLEANSCKAKSTSVIAGVFDCLGI